MRKFSRIVILIISDIICINISYIIALLLRFEFNVESEQFHHYFLIYSQNMFFIVFLKLIIFTLFGLYNSLWKYASTEEIVKVLLSAVGALCVVFLYLQLAGQTIPRGVQGISFFLDIIFIGGCRLSYRSIRNIRNSNESPIISSIHKLKGKGISRVLLVGAGSAGANMIKEIRNKPEVMKKVVAVIDDDKDKIGSRIVGKKIVGDTLYIAEAVKKYSVDEIIIAIPTARRKDVQRIINQCNKTGCKVKILPAIIDLIDGNISISRLRDIEIEDLLGREPVKTDLHVISQYLSDKVILVTGGGGSIGSELCRQIAGFMPRKIIALDIYENNLYGLTHELKDSYPDLQFVPIIASIRDKARIGEIFAKYKPHVVFHAAAHKHVPLMEDNPKEAVLNNILGTKNILDLAHDYVVEKFVLISTDKAVNPTNVMGATKRVAEMLMQDISYDSLTSFSAVRFGNVLGSNGSVLPLFRKQIEKGGPVTVTHEEATRYFMTIPEAVQLVIQTGAIAVGGEIFILDMGDPVRIKDMAENLIRLSGYEPYVDIDIIVTGLRPGEKLYEELLLDEEGIKKTNHDSIYVGKPVPPSEELALLLNKKTLYQKIDSICRGTDEEVKQWLHRLVPNYKNGVCV